MRASDKPPSHVRQKRPDPIAWKEFEVVLGVGELVGDAAESVLVRPSDVAGADVLRAGLRCAAPPPDGKIVRSLRVLGVDAATPRPKPDRPARFVDVRLGVLVVTTDDGIEAFLEQLTRPEGLTWHLVLLDRAPIALRPAGPLSILRLRRDPRPA